jgi:hypothetical protein
MGQTLQHDTNPLSQTGTVTTVDGEYGSVDDHIVFADSDSYSAHIKAISTDEVQFELEDEDNKKK